MDQLLKKIFRKKTPWYNRIFRKKYNVLNKVVMLIHNKKLSVSPLTTHIPLKNVSSNITKKRLLIMFNKFANF